MFFRGVGCLYYLVWSGLNLQMEGQIDAEIYTITKLRFALFRNLRIRILILFRIVGKQYATIIIKMAKFKSLLVETISPVLFFKIHKTMFAKRSEN